MKIEAVYLIDQSPYGYRTNEVSEIIGVVMCTPEGLEPRMCYRLRFYDNSEDFKPVDDPSGKYKIISFTDWRYGGTKP